MNIHFNKPFIIGNELKYISNAVASGKISGNGYYTQKCQQFFEERYGFKKCLLTTSCTDALEMCAILLNIQPGDEVIIPSYTFVSTALAFVRQGAKIVFADSLSAFPNMDVDTIEALISPKTKVIVPVHYAGVACDMDNIMRLANQYNLYVVEDAAQAIDSYYISTLTGEKQALGSIGHLSAFSFHETKNIISGEGGLLAINDIQFIKRAEIIWEKGTNRAEFFRGEVNKYGWVDTGSSFLPSEITAAFLWAQIENIDKIQNKRKEIWNLYYQGLKPLADRGFYSIPLLSDRSNAHMFFVLCPDLESRTKLIEFLKSNGISAVFHYLSLHSSHYYSFKHDGRELTNSDRFSDCLLRLPLYYELDSDAIDYICNTINRFYLQ